ncbi:hypothetical protein C8Q75DRAFT_765130 [Abortiporus biennis]|nr:hypothetical protein C8Q75DRAFT_765130 [Abortiporus biennis]
MPFQLTLLLVDCFQIIKIVFGYYPATAESIRTSIIRNLSDMTINLQKIQSLNVPTAGTYFEVMGEYINKIRSEIVALDGTLPLYRTDHLLLLEQLWISSSLTRRMENTFLVYTVAVHTMSRTPMLIFNHASDDTPSIADIQLDCQRQLKYLRTARNIVARFRKLSPSSIQNPSSATGDTELSSPIWRQVNTYIVSTYIKATEWVTRRGLFQGWRGHSSEATAGEGETTEMELV